MTGSTEENNFERIHHNSMNLEHNNTPMPCACCTALTQLRMPWFEEALKELAYSKTKRNNLSDTNSLTKKNDIKFSKKLKTKNYSKLLSEQFILSKQQETKQEFEKIKKSDNSDSNLENKNDSLEKDSTQTNRTRTLNIKNLFEASFAFILPTIILFASFILTPKRITLILLHHPLEASIELILLLAVPIVNYLVWSSLIKAKRTLAKFFSLLLGSNFTISLSVAILCLSALFLNHSDIPNTYEDSFSLGFIWLSIFSFITAFATFHLINKQRLCWELENSRKQVIKQSVIGSILALLILFLCEYHPWSIRIAQYMSAAKDSHTKEEGLTWLRKLYPEREMRMECSDQRAAGIAGLFFPLKTNEQTQLYFTLTGTPYSFRDINSNDLSSMSDYYLSQQVVGAKVAKFELARSCLSGILHPNTLSASMNWTFVVKNNNSDDKELRLELGIPEDAAITNLTLWRNGEAETANFMANEKVQGTSTYLSPNNSQATMTDLGQGRVLVHGYCVPHEEELKFCVSMIMPLRSENSYSASITTPRIIASNFELEGENQIKLRSSQEFLHNIRGLEKTKDSEGFCVISGLLEKNQLENSPVLITTKRSEQNNPIITLDKTAILLKREDALIKEKIRQVKLKNFEKEKEREKENKLKSEQNEFGQVILMIDGSKGVKKPISDLSNLFIKNQKKSEKSKISTTNIEKSKKIITVQPEYVLEEITKTSSPKPKHLVLVIDGSASIKEYRLQLQKSLSTIPNDIACSVIFASEENNKQNQFITLKQAITKLNSFQFIGGQNNLESVIKASNLASESTNSMVLWIHGPQPVSNQEIYISSIDDFAKVNKPKYFDFPICSGTDTYEFFKNHKDIGPFEQIPRNHKSLVTDLTDFFAKWNPNNCNRIACFKQLNIIPKNAIEANSKESQEILVLHASQKCKELIKTRHFRKAAKLAIYYGFVSPLSIANIPLEKQNIPDADLNELNSLESNLDADKAPVSDNFSYLNGNKLSPDLITGTTNTNILLSEATVIAGVNTAGTVRISNLANLESLFNIIANIGQLAMMIVGIILLIQSIFIRSSLKISDQLILTPLARAVLAIILIFLGNALPGIINGFVASARDANLFS